MTSDKFPKVTLRDHRDGANWENLWAYLDDQGNLHVDGQDFGPQTKPVSDDGEYEFFFTVLAADIPALLRALNADPSADVMHVLATEYVGDRSRDLERVLCSKVVPVSLFRW